MNIYEPYDLVQSIIDSQDNLIVVVEDEKPIIMNKAFLNFFAKSSLEEYENNFGSFVNNFVPHPYYFHSEKVDEGFTWTQSILMLEEKNQIVSMINKAQDPRAFKVKIDDSHEKYEICTFVDISADLIKSIMIENDTNVDKKSGAYTRDYFLYTTEILQDGARFNKKDIGLTVIELLDPSQMKTLVSAIKKVIRGNDILVKYTSNILLLAFLVDTKCNASVFSEKIQKIVNLHIENKISMIVLKDKDNIVKNIDKLIKVCEQIEVNELKII
jgi:hypothetical protein